MALLVALVLAIGSTPAPAQKPRAERPTYNVGEQWLLKDGVYDLIKVEKDRYIFAASAGRQIHLTKNLALVSMLRDRVWEWDLFPVPELSWPLEVGKWGVIYRGTLRNRDHPSGLPVRTTWEVKAYEDVRVVGGVFKAFQILYTVDLETSDALGRGGLQIPGPRSWQLATWYAPEVRRIVKTESTPIGALNLEVVSVERLAATPLEVALDEPKEQGRVTADRITVGGKVTAGAPLARVSATLNGAEVFARDLRGAPARELALSFPLSPREGKNVLVVTVEDAQGGRRQEARVFFRDRPPVAAVPVGPPTVTPPPSPPPTVLPAPGAPPQVAISSPKDQARVSQEALVVAAVASGAKGVSRVLVTLNGVEVARVEERAPQRAVPVNVALKLQEGQNILVVTASDTDGVTQQEVRTVFFDRATPLTVQVRHPEERARLADESSVVAAVATSTQGVTEVSVLLNGTQVFQQRERAPKKSVPIAAPIKLREGANTIVVRATQADGTVSQEVRTVTYERPAAAVAAVPAPKAPASGDRWAVVIGVGRYASSDVPSLRYTVPDAEAFYQILLERAGFKKGNILLLTDKTDRKPTLRDMKWALGTFLARSAKKEDLVVIFYAGHGAPEVDPRGAEPDGLAKYLVPSDADPNDLYSTALPMDELQIIFDRIEAERVVVFLDACYSGAAGGRTFASKRTRALRVDDLFLDRLARSRGRAIVTAARSSVVSIELPELGHGLFTHYLLQGLRGAADLDRDGVVVLQELYTYLEQQVSQKSRASGGNQHPVMKGEMEGLLPLVKVGGR
ncbi:MAG TPA: caspase family protein [Methylomirabilota bacterium]|nr:caspase family protein [Methylomirabilota bacterium]